MPTFIRLAFSFIVLVTLGCNTVAPESNHDLVLTNVNVVDPLNKTIIPNQKIWMSDGVIKTISPASDLVESTKVNTIDGQGGFVTPGLIDMHTHIYDRAAPAIALSHGVVHMRVLNGMPQLLQWREALNKGELWGSTLSVSSPIVTGNPDDALRTYIETTADAHDAVEDALEAGYDLIKVYNSLSLELHDAVITRANELNMPIAQHGPHPPTGMPWERLKGIQSLEHVEDIFQGPLVFKQDAEKLEKTLTKLKALEVPIVPTLSVFEQLTRISTEKEVFLNTLPTDYTPPIVRYVEKTGQVKRWLDASEARADFNRQELEYLIHITREIHDKSMPILVGSDSGVLMLPYGLGTHSEMALLLRAGLSSFEVIQAATVSPAKVLGLDSELGQIKRNARADFIYTRSNPTQDLTVLREPDAVVKKGRWYSAESLIAHRENAIRKRSLFKELWLLLSNL
jgi:hypothetical protein